MDRPSETHTPQPELQRAPRRTLTHLVVGALAFGLDALSQRLQQWDDRAAQEQGAVMTAAPAGDREGLAAQEQGLLELPTQTSEADAPVQGVVLLPARDGSTGGEVRYALVGMLFNAQDHLSSGLHRADRITRRLYTGSARLFEPLTSSPLAAPFASRWQSLVRRGELQVSNWVERGRIEEQAGVVIARQAVEGTTGEVIDVLADHPGIKELVEKQSTSFAGEIVEEIRERTVSLDTLFERISRRVLRKPPRPLLPSPSDGKSVGSGEKPTHPNVYKT